MRECGARLLIGLAQGRVGAGQPYQYRCPAVAATNILDPTHTLLARTPARFDENYPVAIVVVGEIWVLDGLQALDRQ